MSRIIQFFPNSDLRCNHLGLHEKALKARVNTHKLKLGEFAVFMNSRQTQLKILTTRNVLINFRTEGGRIDLSTIQEIPNYISHGRFKYNDAVRKRLKKGLLGAT